MQIGLVSYRYIACFKKKELTGDLNRRDLLRILIENDVIFMKIRLSQICVTQELFGILYIGLLIMEKLIV